MKMTEWMMMDVDDDECSMMPMMMNTINE